MIDIELDGGTVRIPEFAMDKSIQTLIQLAKQQGFKTGEIEKADKRTATVLSRMEKVLTNQAKQVDQQTKEEKKQTKLQKKDTDESSKVRKAIDDSTKSNSEKLEKLAEKIGDKNAGGLLGGVVGKLGIFSKFLSVGAAAIGGFVTALTTAFKFLMRLGKLEGGLFRTGFFNFAAQDGVAQGIASLGMMATRAGMTMEQAAEFTSQFAKAMDAFGTKSIVDAAVTTQDLLREQGFLALSLQEINGIVGEQAEVFARAGLQVGNNGQRLAAQSVEIARTTQAFSELTKTSADVIRNIVIQNSSNEVFLNRLNMLPDEIRESALASSQTAFAGLAAFGEESGGQLANILSQGIGFGDLGFVEGFRELTVTSPQLADSLRGLNNTIIGGGSVTDSLEDFRKSILNVSESERQRLQALAIMGDSMSQTVLQLINQQQLLSDETNSFVKMAQKMSTLKPEKLAEVQVKLSNALTLLTAQFQKLALAFLTESNIQAFNNIITSITKFVTDMSEDGGLFSTISASITKAMENTTEFMAKVKDFFSNGLSGMTNFITTALTGGISSGIARGVALALPGGDDGDKLKEYDALVDKLKQFPSNLDDLTTQQKADRQAIINQLLEASGFGKFATIDGVRQPTTGLKGQERAMTEAELENTLQRRIGEYYSGSITGYKVPGSTSPINDDGSSNETDNSGTQESMGNEGAFRSKIRIMPMFGDPQSFIEQGEMSEGEYRRKQIEMLQSQIDLLNKINNSTANSQLYGKMTLEEHRALRT